MPRAPRRILAAATIALAALAAGGATAAASSPGAPASAPAASNVPTTAPTVPVESKTVAAIDVAGTAGLARSVAIRIADPDDIWRLEQVFADAPPDPTHPATRRRATSCSRRSPRRTPTRSPTSRCCSSA